MLVAVVVPMLIVLAIIGFLGWAFFRSFFRAAAAGRAGNAAAPDRPLRRGAFAFYPVVGLLAIAAGCGLAGIARMLQGYGMFPMFMCGALAYAAALAFGGNALPYAGSRIPQSEPLAMPLVPALLAAEMVSNGLAVLHALPYHTVIETAAILALTLVPVLALTRFLRATPPGGRVSSPTSG